jgi:hypothetical protein
MFNKSKDLPLYFIFLENKYTHTRLLTFLDDDGELTNVCKWR